MGLGGRSFCNLIPARNLSSSQIISKRGQEEYKISPAGSANLPFPQFVCIEEVDDPTSCYLHELHIRLCSVATAVTYYIQAEDRVRVEIIEDISSKC